MIASSDTQVFPVLWQDDHLVLIDQRQLPERYSIVAIRRCDDVVRSLRSGIVQGGSALGLAAAYGLYLGRPKFTPMTQRPFGNASRPLATSLSRPGPIRPICSGRWTPC